MYKIAVIEKYLATAPFWSNLIRKKQITELSVEQIIDRYQGFEGELIEFLSAEEFKISSHEIPKNSRVLILNSFDEMLPPSLKECSLQIGFDIGVCEVEKTLFSSIFNEILFGNLKELTEFQHHLNNQLLFPDKANAEKYVSFHKKLSAQGKDVEDYEELIIYEVRKYKT